MKHHLIFQLEENKRHLEYYQTLKNQSESGLGQITPKNSSIQKWIEIYTDRVLALESEVQKLGLRTEIRDQIAPQIADNLVAAASA